ncbi:Crp/Fnr family transcriptional regulator [Listeria newyorkensis]|uniref:Crp/Fnr family transcriptional regulator n=1 Tax=Listeria newyorkensis TaxID=1497681 RepID=A0A841YY41_9LIST|nr:Crp/Fnr family transcriptional regulator [Listeria newyorkensis]MBC1457862.1 Crp/Fnr family transcriptional regulator [Listeria newyorkensis]
MMLEQQTKEMHMLYNAETVTKEFNERKFYYYLQKDVFPPLAGTMKRFKKHEFLMKEKDTIDEIYFIQSGCVMAIKNDSWVFDFYAETDIIGFDSLLLSHFATHSFQVISDEVIAMKYKKSEIIEKVLNAQEGYLYYYVHVHNQVKRLLAKEALLRLPSEERIGLALLQIIKGYRDRTIHRGRILFPKHINKGILAKYTNLNPNTITTVLQKFQDQAIIQVIHQRMHVDIWKLRSKLE